jgi:transcription elongation factor Elf1
MANNIFHCLRCGKNRAAKSMRTVLKPGAGAGVSMNFYTARCPVCGRRMTKIASIAGCSKKRR